MMQRYAVITSVNGDDIEEKLKDGDKYTCSATSGVQAILLYINRKGMPYNVEIIAFERVIVTADKYLANDFGERLAVPYDVKVYNEATGDIELYNSVATVMQTEFPF